MNDRPTTPIVITFPTAVELCEWLWSQREPWPDATINAFINAVRAAGDNGVATRIGGFHYLVGLA